MTKFKVGDRVKLLEIGGSVNSRWGYVEGDTATICDASNAGSIKLSMDNPKNEYYNVWVMEDEIGLVDATPPATIQHEGYNYTRGEPVVPEWVKDGAWVVDIVHGRVLQMRSHSCIGYALYDQKGNNTHLDADISNCELFRPFTNSDWKWGMWAEYRGGKVFVCAAESYGIYASKPTEYFFVDFCDITPTTAP